MHTAKRQRSGETARGKEQSPRLARVTSAEEAVLMHVHQTNGQARRRFTLRNLI